AYTSRVPVTSAGAQLLSFDVLLNTSDVISLHLPLTGQTHHLIDRRALARMKRSAYLVNTARGPVVDEGALAWALQEHLIAGAAHRRARVAGRGEDLELAGGGYIPGPHRDAAVCAHTGRDNPCSVEAAVSRRPHTASDDGPDREANRSLDLPRELLPSQGPPC